MESDNIKQTNSRTGNNNDKLHEDLVVTVLNYKLSDVTNNLPSIFPQVDPEPDRPAPAAVVRVHPQVLERDRGGQRVPPTQPHVRAGAARSFLYSVIITYD